MPSALVAPQFINGNRYDYSSIEIKFDPIGVSRVIGIKEISYKDTLDPGIVRGTSAEMLGRTRGEYSCEGSFTIYLAEWHELVRILQAQKPPAGATFTGYLEANFDMTINYAEDGSPMHTDRLIGCRIKTIDRSHSQGKDALVRKCDMTIMKVLDGLNSPLSVPLSGLGLSV